ncbi:hypothetical protein FRC02_009184 [Tulasnella sp. 418]|nr:hypothetical protein FRC02_009184 [Tulasnella sp. 418]
MSSSFGGSSFIISGFFKVKSPSASLLEYAASLFSPPPDQKYYEYSESVFQAMDEENTLAVTLPAAFQLSKNKKNKMSVRLDDNSMVYVIGRAGSPTPPL